MRKRQYAIKRKLRRRMQKRLIVIYVLVAAVFLTGACLIITALSSRPGDPQQPSASLAMTPPDDIALPDGINKPGEKDSLNMLSADILPHYTENTDPEKFGVVTQTMVNGDKVGTYLASEPVAFGQAGEYTQIEGITTFRGNNYRDLSSYGFINSAPETLEIVAKKKTGSVRNKGGATYTGQPLIVKWPEITRKNMTALYPQYKDKEGFVEVIYATISGHIYFLDLFTGEFSRDPIATNAPVVGTACLDPRGYPIIYVGQGMQSNGKSSGCKDIYMRAFSLADGTLLMKFGWQTSDPFAHRDWQAYDSSPLVEGNSDTLIIPGENGVLYACRLNSFYDEEDGSVSMDREPYMVKYRYTSPRNEESSKKGRWGTKSSAVVWRDNLVFADNAGMLSCVNLNTMQIVYVNDLTDDSDMTMVLEEDNKNDTFYLYGGCTYDPLVRPLGDTATVYARKIDGMTGEIVLEKSYTVKSGKNKGGIFASPVLGMAGTDMEGLIVYTVTQRVAGDSITSSIVALDKTTFEQVWEFDLQTSGWSPSSPVSVYTKEGKGYIVQCSDKGDVVIIDGATGGEVTRVNVSEPIEATPAVYNDTIVVASAKANIYLFKIA